tara:strand:+ start:503 stop:622 length:120 start_codon:yes stop_codon:yes gene_type:complete
MVCWQSRNVAPSDVYLFNEEWYFEKKQAVILIPGEAELF